MDRQHHVPAGFLLDVVQKRRRVDIRFFLTQRPKAVSFPDYDDAFRSGIHVGAIPTDLWVGSRRMQLTRQQNI